jgi:hypothetical protein
VLGLHKEKNQALDPRYVENQWPPTTDIVAKQHASATQESINPLHFGQELTRILNAMAKCETCNVTSEVFFMESHSKNGVRELDRSSLVDKRPDKRERRSFAERVVKIMGAISSSSK